MEIIPSEMLRGHIDTIILLSLIDDDKHTNQIREEIEARSDGKFELKQGTFYSCLQRIVKQGYVTEYRSTSSDGVRRKFYQLTEKGKTYIDENKDKWVFSRSLINELIKTPEKPAEAEKKQKIEASKPATQQTEDFDIDKALRDFMSSDDAPAKIEKDQEAFPTNPSQASPAPQSDALSDLFDNVTIIDLGEVANQNNKQKKVADDYSTPQTAAAPQTTRRDIPMPLAEKSISPEEYDIITLIGPSDTVETKTTHNEVEYDSPIATFIQPEITEESTSSQPVLEPMSEVAVAEPTNTVSEPTPIYTSQDFNDYAEEDDFYNGEVTITHDYKSVLQKLFPSKPKEADEQEEPREMVYVSGTDINSYFEEKSPQPEESTTDDQIPAVEDTIVRQTIVPQCFDKKTARTEPSQEPTDDLGYDFSDIKSLAKIEGFKVSFSTNSVKKKVNSILLNKLNVISCLIFYLIALAEIALLAYFTKDQAQLTLNAYIIAAVVLAILPLTALIIFFINPRKKVASIPTLKSVIEMCIVVMLNLVVIMIVYSILASADYSSNMQLLRYVLYPSIAILNIPIYFIIKYLNLENPKFYH